MDEKEMRVLWFANTPGLSQHRFNPNSVAGGWISSLQAEVEKVAQCRLGFVFYSDQKMDPFEYNGTAYFPVQRMAHQKSKRLFYRITGRTEYDENLSHFLRIIEMFKPDLINIHGTENSFGLVLNHTNTIPVAITIQGNLTVYAKKYFSGIARPGLFSQLISGNPFFTMDYKQFVKRSAIEREILKKSRYIFGRTDWDRRISLVLAPGADYFHTEEIMRPVFYQMQWQAPQNQKPVFFTTSSHSWYKGFETIVETASLLVKNNFPFNWQVAGLKETDSLVQLIKKKQGINRLEEVHISLLGQLTEKELAGRMIGSDIYVQVSHIENSPNSICEAMLLGMPIIASFAGGTSSLLKDGETGMLVQDGDPFALAGALIETVRAPENSITMAGKAYCAARKRHNKEDIVSRLLAAYDKIIKTHRALC
jgi:glycosyltransferase involved in cell wall biosynthesis